MTSIDKRVVIITANLLCCILEASSGCASKRTGAKPSDIHLCLGASNFFVSSMLHMVDPKAPKIRQSGIFFTSNYWFSKNWEFLIRNFLNDSKNLKK